MPTPLGTDPIEIDGIIIRRDVRLKEGGQLFYDRDGKPIGYGRIGGQCHIFGTVAQITLHPLDYEMCKLSHLQNKIRIERFRAQH
jgi:hypothetical protein